MAHVVKSAWVGLWERQVVKELDDACVRGVEAVGDGVEERAMLEARDAADARE